MPNDKTFIFIIIKSQLYQFSLLYTFCYMCNVLFTVPRLFTLDKNNYTILYYT